MAPRFQPRITGRRARFRVDDFTPGDMIELGQSLIGEGIQARLSRGVNVYDQPAKPLAMKYQETYKDHKLQRLGADRGYRAQKVRRGGQPIRDWKLTGQLWRSMKVLSAGVNRCTVGILDYVRGSVKNRIGNLQIASIQQHIEPMWGAAQSDLEVVARKANEIFRRKVKTEKVA